MLAVAHAGVAAGPTRHWSRRGRFLFYLFLRAHHELEEAVSGL